MSDDTKKEVTAPRVRLSSVKTSRPSFAPKIPTATINNTPPPLVKPKKERNPSKRGSKNQRGRGKPRQRRDRAPIPLPVQKIAPSVIGEPIAS